MSGRGVFLDCLLEILEPQDKLLSDRNRCWSVSGIVTFSKQGDSHYFSVLSSYLQMWLTLALVRIGTQLNDGLNSVA